MYFLIDNFLVKHKSILLIETEYWGMDIGGHELLIKVPNRRVKRQRICKRHAKWHETFT